jgi:hypothetical protein
VLLALVAHTVADLRRRGLAEAPASQGKRSSSPAA